MKRYLSIILSILCILLFIGCGKNVEHETETPSQDYFNAIVLEIKNGVVLAECTECESGVISVGSQVSVNLDTVSSEEIPLLVVGDTIRVVYIGGIIESDPLKLQEVLSIFWVDENGEIVTEGAKITEIKHEPIEKPDWGIQLTVENITPTGLTIVCSQSDVDVNGELFAGTYYSLSKYEDGEWKEVNYLLQEDEICWTDEAWNIPMDDVVKWDVDWNWLYGEMEAGTYRISKSIMNTVPGNLETATYDVKFDIK